MTLRAKCEVQPGNQKPSLPRAVFSSNSSVVNIRFTENHIPESSVCKKNTDLVVRVLGFNLYIHCSGIPQRQTISPMLLIALV